LAAAQNCATSSAKDGFVGFIFGTEEVTSVLGILFFVIKLAGRSTEGFIGDEAFTVVSAFVGALRRVSVLPD